MILLVTTYHPHLLKLENIVCRTCLYLISFQTQGWHSWYLCACILSSIIIETFCYCTAQSTYYRKFNITHVCAPLLTTNIARHVIMCSVPHLSTVTSLAKLSRFSRPSLQRLQPHTSSLIAGVAFIMLTVTTFIVINNAQFQIPDFSRFGFGLVQFGSVWSQFYQLFGLGVFWCVLFIRNWEMERKLLQLLSNR